jgi:hypothetical protein
MKALRLLKTSWTAPKPTPSLNMDVLQEEEDPNASDFEGSIDKPETVLLTYQTILNINDDKFIFGTLPENPIQPLPSTSRHSYISKVAPESSKPLRTQQMHTKQKKDSLKNLKSPGNLAQMKPKKQQKLSLPKTSASYPSGTRGTGPSSRKPGTRR